MYLWVVETLIIDTLVEWAIQFRSLRHTSVFNQHGEQLSQLDVLLILRGKQQQLETREALYGRSWRKALTLPAET
jgi:hypothetical protein